MIVLKMYGVSDGLETDANITNLYFFFWAGDTVHRQAKNAVMETPPGTQ